LARHNNKSAKIRPNNALTHGNRKATSDRLIMIDRAGMCARLDRIVAILPTIAAKADVNELRADILKAIATARVWMIVTMIGLFVGFLALLAVTRTAP
jgi:hypothetical protein